MITRFLLIRNIGQFASVDAGRAVPLRSLTLIHSENGRGKTTLAELLRSLSTNDPAPIMERHRLGATADPEVVIELDSGGPATFRGRTWNQTVEAIVFDERFVDLNVYSGLAVEAAHRQNLHEVVLGPEAVALARRLRGLVDRIEGHNHKLRDCGARFPADWLNGLSVDSFCDLPVYDDVDERIADSERNLAVARNRQEVIGTPALEGLSLPDFDVDVITDLLSRGIPTLRTEALRHVREHIARLGPGAEEWVLDGVRRAQVGGVGLCPYCGQTINPESIANDYSAYFADAYRALVSDIDQAIADVRRQHSGDAQASLERQVRLLGERAVFWRRFATLPAFDLDTDIVVGRWRTARDAALAALSAKRASPLEPAALAQDAREAIRAYGESRRLVGELNARIEDANVEIAVAKERAAADTVELVSPDLQKLRAVKARHSEDGQAACADYLAEKTAKAQTEEERDDVRRELDSLRATTSLSMGSRCQSREATPPLELLRLGAR